MHAAVGCAAAVSMQATLQLRLTPVINEMNILLRNVYHTCLRALSRASLLLWSHCMLLVLLSAGLRPCAL
jgi:hypothetical protein